MATNHSSSTQKQPRPSHTLWVAPHSVGYWKWLDTDKSDEIRSCCTMDLDGCAALLMISPAAVFLAHIKPRMHIADCGNLFRNIEMQYGIHCGQFPKKETYLLVAGFPTTVDPPEYTTILQETEAFVQNLPFPATWFEFPCQERQQTRSSVVVDARERKTSISVSVNGTKVKVIQPPQTGRKSMTTAKEPVCGKC